MSEKSWRREHYPIPARKVKKEDAVDHDLKKWFGATEDALKRHGVEIKSDYRKSIAGIEFSGDTCALCLRYCRGEILNACRCEKCPIRLATGSPCDMSGNGEKPPWYSWQEEHDPWPMIIALIAAKKYEDEQKEKK